jgi:hypothetical protein
VKLFVLWSESDCAGDVNIIPLKKTIPGIPLDVVAVNYAVFAISIFINYYLEMFVTIHFVMKFS